MGRMTGERVTLREFREEDLSGMRSWMTDEQSIRYLGGNTLRPATWEMSERALRRLLEGDEGGYHWVIAERGNLRYLGQVSLIWVDHLHRKAEMTLVMAPDQAGKGYAREGLSLALRFAFEKLNLHRVYLKTVADNERAVRLYEGCGFRTEGRLREELFLDGRYADVLVMGLLEDEWSARQGAACQAREEGCVGHE